MSGTYFITSYVVNNRGKLSQFKTIDINQFNTDRRNYYIEQVEFTDQGLSQ